MRISAIIPAYNVERFLERAVNSLLETRYPDLEIIVVDDGSTDRTLELAQTLCINHPAEVRVFQHPDNKSHGVSVTRNLGIQMSTGEFICFLDADDYVYPHRFDVAVKLLRNDPEIDAVHEVARMEFAGERGVERFWDSEDLFGIRNSPDSASTLRALLGGVCWPTSGILLRKATLEKCGVFPENYAYAEDFHLWLKLAATANVVPGNSQQPVSAYFRHGGNTYQGGLERKNDVIRAMTDVYRWLKDKRRQYKGTSDFAAAVVNYIRYALMQAREKDRCDLGRKLIWTVIRNGFYPAFQDLRTLHQVAWVLIGRVARKSGEASVST